ncbi:MAG TPA: sensor histidine kinase, partial [Betaproteobacteria bacterium]|nr:sensor histidine kinase [Betaproteobacteria bacterium]
MLGTIELAPRPDGSAGWFQSDKIPIHDENGEVVGVTIFVTDVSERLRAEEELKRLNEVLEQRVAAEAAKNREKDLLLIQQSRLAAMGEMMGNIAHQWRQPLNALGVLLSNVRDAYDFGELDGAMLDHSITDGRRLIQKMSTTIDDFRNFFRPNRQKVAFSLQESVEEAIALVDASFKNNNIVIHFQRGEEMKIVGFPNEFSQVLLNLLSNAKDVLGGKTGQREVSIQVSRTADSVRVAVHDNGGGISGSVLPKIFDPYFTTREKGTGIGLYMSKMIVENMDGSIFARNIGD